MIGVAHAIDVIAYVKEVTDVRSAVPGVFQKDFVCYGIFQPAAQGLLRDHLNWEDGKHKVISRLDTWESSTSIL